MILSQVVALRKESVDRNHKDLTQWFRNYGSLSARRAWIEIAFLIGSRSQKPVALRKESVDRNRNYGKQHNVSIVALRKESVDRNRNSPNKLTNAHVALRKESVDRNKQIISN